MFLKGGNNMIVHRLEVEGVGISVDSVTGRGRVTGSRRDVATIRWALGLSDDTRSLRGQTPVVATCRRHIQNSPGPFAVTKREPGCAARFRIFAVAQSGGELLLHAEELDAEEEG